MPDLSFFLDLSYDPSVSASIVFVLLQTPGPLIYLSGIKVHAVDETIYHSFDPLILPRDQCLNQVSIGGP